MKKIILILFLSFYCNLFANVSSDCFYILTKDEINTNEKNIEKIKYNEIVFSTPDPIVSTQTLCTGSTVANLVATGTDIKWYANSSGGSALLPTTVLVSATYYATQTISGIESARTPAVITILANVTPVFTPVDPVCSGASMTNLPTTSNNGITGTWSPALNNLITTTYTFTPNPGQCATNTTMTIVVEANTVPTFSPISPICSGDALASLPTTSNNGFTGSWSPALNNTVTTTYTFTPTAGQCATTTTLTITVVQVTFTAITTTATCLNTNATITMNGLVPNSVSDVTYSLAGITQPIVSVTADNSGIGTFPVLMTVAGSIVEIISIKRTDYSMPSCILFTNFFGNSVVLTANPNCTLVTPSQCNTTLATIDTFIYANLIAAAQGYRWKVTTLTGTNAGQVQTTDTPLRNLKISQLATYAYGVDYQIEVAVLVSNVWTPFSVSCKISTPLAYSQLSNCNLSLTKMSDFIFSTIVSYTTGYRFKITNSINPSDTQTIDKVIRNFRMSELIGIQYDATYYVEVAVKNTDGVYMPYGAVCTVKTPFFPITQIIETQCDYAVPTMTTTIFAEPFGEVGEVQEYRFLMVETPYTQSINRPTNDFILNNFTGLTSGTSYNIQVALKIGNIWGPYGKVCRITVP